MDIAPLLHVTRGVTALIGGGGKTTLLYTLAEELRRRGTVIITTSTHIQRPEQYPVLPEGGKDAITAALSENDVVCVAGRSPEGKLSAPALPFELLSELADYVLVEADGSKRLPLKAHASHEPVIPREANQVICVVGASGLNHPAAEKVHRPERFMALSGSDTAAPEAVAAVLNKEALHTRVLINQADSPERIAAARELARLLNCPVVVASLQKGELLCVY